MLELDEDWLLFDCCELADDCLLTFADDCEPSLPVDLLLEACKDEDELLLDDCDWLDDDCLLAEIDWLPAAEFLLAAICDEDDELDADWLEDWLFLAMEICCCC